MDCRSSNERYSYYSTDEEDSVDIGNECMIQLDTLAIEATTWDLAISKDHLEGMANSILMAPISPSLNLHHSSDDYDVYWVVLQYNNAFDGLYMLGCLHDKSNTYHQYQFHCDLFKAWSRWASSRHTVRWLEIMERWGLFFVSNKCVNDCLIPSHPKAYHC